MPRTPKLVEDRREQILDAALRVFAQKGFAHSTNRDVAHEAGITTGLIYYYFANKEALLKAVLETYSPAQIVAQITPEMLEQQPEILLPFLVQRVLTIIEGEPFVGMIRVILPELLHDTTQVSPITRSLFQRTLDFLGNYLKAQVARGTLRADLDTEMAAQLVVSSLMGMVMRRQIMHDPSVLRYTHEEITRAVVGPLLAGIHPG